MKNVKRRKSSPYTIVILILSYFRTERVLRAATQCAAIGVTKPFEKDAWSDANASFTGVALSSAKNATEKLKSAPATN